MKELKVLKLALLIIGMLIMSNRLEAAGCQITYPLNGRTLYCPVGQTSMDVTITWNGTAYPDQTNGGTNSGYTGNYYYNLTIDGVLHQHLNTTSYDAGYQSVGQHSIYLVMYETWLTFDPFTGNPVYTDYFIGSDASNYTIAVTATHGSCSCPVSRQLSAGTQSNSQTSAYISPGSTVSWSLSYNIFNEYWNNSIPCSTSATAQIGSPLNQSLTATASGNYQGMQDSRSSTYTYTAGGTLTLSASVSIGSNASGGSASATISW